MNEEDMQELNDVLHILIDRVRWFSEAARDNAHAIIERTKTVAAKEPAVKKAAKAPRTSPSTDA
jgi:hypothetical protein